ncbi:hypothetical protein A2U01_0077955, partial [Trifolium medium]|nr:hypothetical protein [Trifolium medium]
GWFLNRFVLADDSFAFWRCESSHNTLFLLFGFVPVRGFAG